jgi:hypothetical protein
LAGPAVFAQLEQVAHVAHVIAAERQGSAADEPREQLARQTKTWR